MTTVTITGTVSGYSLNSPVTELIVAKTGYVGGNGINGGASAAYTVLNSGRVVTYTNNAGVYLRDGGQVNNGGGADTTAMIAGEDCGVRMLDSGTVDNSGTIIDQAYGHVINGGVYFESGTATVINGSGVDDHALIEGGNGVMFRNATGSVANFGTIIGEGVQDSDGVYLYDGGSLTNGSVTDKTALIEGPSGVYQRFNAALTVTNFGTILGVNYSAVLADFGGKVTNGAAGDTSALISGFYGVQEFEAATVTNFGTILGLGTSDEGIRLTAGGGVINGTSADRAASIQGYDGVLVYGSGYVANFATISGTGGYDHFGVKTTGGAAIYNGKANDKSAVIEGYGGVYLSNAAVSKNFGLIQGLGNQRQGSGAYIRGSTKLINYGTLAGFYGAVVENGATLVNDGTLTGVNGISVYVAEYGSLVVDAGSVFDGAAASVFGAVQLANGVGTISDGGGGLVVSGSMPTATFAGFGTIQIDAGASFTLSGNPDVFGGYSLDILGLATAAGTLIINGDLGLGGTLAGAGALVLAYGSATFETGADLTIAKVTEIAGSSAYFDAASLTVADVWTQTGGVISVATGDKVSFTGAGDTFDGTLSGAGTVDFTAGTDALTGATITAAAGISGAGTVTFSGAIDLTSTLAVTSPNVVIATAGATLSGKGVVSLSNLATNVIKGASATAKLTNGDIIKGAGQLGDGEMALSNIAGGVIDANLTTALVINLGANTLSNAGVIENVGTGGLTITGALSSTDLLEVTAGTLTVDGAVSGAGTVKIVGGTADFGSTFTENVTFTTAGVLELADATTYTGQITGFAKTAVTSLDLLDIDFVSGTTKATFSGTSTSGVLTVTDGTHTAKITLEGNYMTSTFTVTSDGHGGTSVTDPAKAVAATPPPQPWRIGPEPLFPHPLVTAMAGFGAGTAGGAPARVDPAAHPTISLLASPMVNAA